MHQQSLDRPYCKRENSLTKLNNSECVMILVVRLASSPKTEKCLNGIENIYFELSVQLGMQMLGTGNKSDGHSNDTGMSYLGAIKCRKK
jgi:hypothetical protein